MTQLKDHLNVIHAKDGDRFHDRRRAPKIMDQVRGVCFEHNPARRKGEVEDCDRHHDPDQDFGSAKNVKLRFDAFH